MNRSNLQRDPFYGYEQDAKMCARFISHFFSCPEVLPQPPPNLMFSPPTTPPSLTHFIAYALHRTRLHPSVLSLALALLHRLKARFPAARGSSGHRLFLSSYMIASKVICDDTYSHKSWAVVGQGMFAVREVKQMEREMCSYLEWQLHMPQQEFEEKLRNTYSHPPP
ncbi:hypothetical protein BD410DRAFT_817001 [Rickenella mellea]|uniref:Cyclin N-terminal domain-containing protein n=1 Tax=Rickenella mellea TaxID=50990 RepID=A0A4Y7PJS7_9AGAM|nr:hypothetical protein BD410DRAFT_817001 [Rickenella mellea]